jgi:hypothetical protein
MAFLPMFKTPSLWSALEIKKEMWSGYVRSGQTRIGYV